jgi:hypothetical protein
MSSPSTATGDERVQRGAAVSLARTLRSGPGNLLQVDVERRNAMLRLMDYHAAPLTNFDLPLKVDRMALVPGDYAKVVFQQDGESHSECVWVEVEELLATGRYRGRLANDPIVVKMRYADTVVFDWFNVIAIEMRN